MIMRNEFSMIDNNLKNIIINSRLGRIDGWTNGEIAFFDLYDHQSQKYIRHFILLEKSVKLIYEPFSWKYTWYIDLVQIKYENNEMVLIDLYLDVLVKDNGNDFKIVDFDDLADALVEGKVSSIDLEKPLKGFQKFLNENLYNHQYPPAEIKDYFIETK